MGSYLIGSSISHISEAFISFRIGCLGHVFLLICITMLPGLTIAIGDTDINTFSGLSSEFTILT
jgi:hypothetical protein